MRSSLLIVIVIMVGLVSFAATAAVPSLLNYQGMLRDAAGDPVPDGNYSVTFRIWDSEISGAAIWQEGRLVTVQDGLFTVLLGSIVPIPDTLFSNPNRWIGLEVGLDPEMSPRQRLVSAPFAWQSLHANRADTASTAKAVDTSGFSAYQDLLSEGRIGDQPGQVAEGDHLHLPANGSSHMMRYEDDGLVDTVLSAPGDYILKSVAVPPGEVGSFMRISFSLKSTDQSPSSAIELVVDGRSIFSTPALGERMLSWWAQHVYDDENDEQWVGMAVYYPNFAQSPFPVNISQVNARIDRTDGVSIMLKVANGSAGARYRCGNLIVEYDKD